MTMFLVYNKANFWYFIKNILLSIFNPKSWFNYNNLLLYVIVVLIILNYLSILYFLKLLFKRNFVKT